MRHCESLTNIKISEFFDKEIQIQLATSDRVIGNNYTDISARDVWFSPRTYNAHYSLSDYLSPTFTKNDTLAFWTYQYGILCDYTISSDLNILFYLARKGKRHGQRAKNKRTR